ncbi:phospholipase A1-like [Atheta coriaria]|uniref:phospholipase A1-like n=1 Tax=Dalotia coriaria TaxID=877792 RepID=UPI0031F427A3
MNPNYASSASVVRQVADEVASFIRRLQRLALIQSVELVGFSLGAHIAGLVGRTLSVYLGQTDLVSEIIALDPAGPGFTDFFTSYQHDKLEPTDAKVVITLVTNAGCSGSSQRLGTINFIANNGRDQVGCARHDCICSHRKAVEYFIDSLTSFAFVGTNSQFKTHAVFGRGLNDRTPAGDYNFRTNLVSPFGRA